MRNFASPSPAPRRRRLSWWERFRQRPTWKLDLLLGAIGLLMAFTLTATAAVLWRWWTSPLSTPPTPATPLAGAAQGTDFPNLQDLAALPTAMPGAPIPPQPWDGYSRVNLLLMGVDTRTWDSNWGPPRADTLILLTLDPETQSAGMLSLPRDLFVEIPGFGYGKINTAYVLGQRHYGEWGGATLTVRTVERLLNVSIPYFVVVDFRSFILLVDAMGGVKVDIPETIVVDIQSAQGYKNIRLEPGRQTINGEMALAYARSRAKPVNGLDGDFGRMYRQRIILMGLINRLKEPWVWERLTAQAPFLYHELAQSLKTNVRPQDAVAWARIAARIPPERITLLAVGHGQTQADFYNGMYILRPDLEAIAALRDQLFAPPRTTATATPTAAVAATHSSTSTASPEPPTLGPPPTPNLQAALQEHATIIVLNGTLTPQLACRTAAALDALGFQVVGVGNADENLDQTLVEVYADRPATLAYLLPWLGIDPQREVYRLRFMALGSGEADFRLILGQDWAAQKGDTLPTTCLTP